MPEPDDDYSWEDYLLDIEIMSEPSKALVVSPKVQDSFPDWELYADWSCLS